MPANVADGNTSTFWESTDNAFPQWFQVDLGASKSFSRIVLDLPQSTSRVPGLEQLSESGRSGL